MAKLIFMFKQGMSKLRRYYLTKFRKEFVKQQMAKRKGACKRCGACCKILFKCPYLRYNSEGLAECTIYEKRFEQCDKFPIDNRDFENIPGTECGFYYE